MAKQSINPYHILDEAKKFLTSANHLSQISTQYMCSDNSDENTLSVSSLMSSIVIYALSIEVGLKSLIKMGNNKYGNEHDLKKLFNKLSEDLRSNVISELSEERLKVNFESYLEENKNAFIEWRYSYEEQSVRASSDFLKAFSEAIIKVAESL